MPVETKDRVVETIQRLEGQGYEKYIPNIVQIERAELCPIQAYLDGISLKVGASTLTYGLNGTEIAGVFTHLNPRVNELKVVLKNCQTATFQLDRIINIAAAFDSPSLPRPIYRCY